MKKLFLLLVIAMLAISYNQEIVAQDYLKEVYVKEHIPNKTPVPYPYLREADVMWSKVVYRMVDLRQKQNQVLYYPKQPIGSRMNITDLLLYGIDNEGIRAFSTMDPLNEFSVQLTRDQIDFAFGAGMKEQKIPDENGILRDTVIEMERRTYEVKKLLLKEKWFFDKNHSVMKVQIIGVCPIRVYFREDDMGNPTDELMFKQTFWVYFPEIRQLLAGAEVFNPQNDSQNVSFDDFFTQRRFGSTIYKVSNVYDNRRIGDYTLGEDQLLEANRLREWLFNIEHDLWEY